MSTNAENSTPQMVAEARVELINGDKVIVTTAAHDWIVKPNVGWVPFPFMLLPETPGYYWPDAEYVGKLLAEEHRLAGVYPRPEGATCSCVGFKDLRGVLAAGALVGHVLCPLDRSFAWTFDPDCPNCLRGVPRTQQPPERLMPLPPPFELAPGVGGHNAEPPAALDWNPEDVIGNGRHPRRSVRSAQGGAVKPPTDEYEEALAELKLLRPVVRAAVRWKKERERFDRERTSGFKAVAACHALEDAVARYLKARKPCRKRKTASSGTVVRTATTPARSMKS